MVLALLGAICPTYRLLFAVNDQPVSVGVRISHALADAGVARRSEWAASVGLTVRALGC